MTQKTDPFASPKGRLRRANRLIAEFIEAEREYQLSKPLEQFEEIHPDDGYRIFKVRLAKPIPEELTDHVYDAIQNLRATLDQSLAPLRKKRCYFPFAEDAVQFGKKLKALESNLPQEIIDLLKGFATHKVERPPLQLTGFFATIPIKKAREILDPQNVADPSHVLCALNDLNNLNKHEITRPVGFGSYSYEYLLQHGAGLRMNAPEWDPEKNEMELYQMAPDGWIESGVIKFECAIALAGVEAVDGDIASLKLQEFSAEVEKILTQIEDTALKHNLV